MMTNGRRITHRLLSAAVGCGPFAEVLASSESRCRQSGSKDGRLDHLYNQPLRSDRFFLASKLRTFAYAANILFFLLQDSP